MKQTIEDRKIIFPQMGCGTWAWGNRLLWDYQSNMDKDLQEVFNLCVSNGVTLFDTGDSYGTGKLNGRSEILLGKFATEYQGENKDKICLATKLAPYPWRLTSKSIIKASEASAKRFDRSIDLVQMHWSTANYFPPQEWQLLKGLADLYEQKKVKAIGLSNYGAKRLKKVARIFTERNIKIATLQVQYSLLSTYPVTQLGVKEVCDELGIKLIAYSPLALGILTGKYNENNLPTGIRQYLCKQILPSAKSLLNTIEAIAQSRNKTMSQVALNWCICKGTIPIPGAKNPQQAQQNIGAMGWSLDDGEITELDKEASLVKKPMVQNIFQTK